MHHSEKSLIELLTEADITINRDENNFMVSLEKDGKVIAPPRHCQCYRVVKEQFGIDLTTFND